MARVPVITSPCPLRFNTAPQPGKDFCGQCQRRVHNLDGMSEARREAFFASCSGKVCVSYTVRRAISAVSVGVTASVLLGSAAMATEDMIETPSPACDLDVVLVGGTTAGENLQWVDESEAALPDNAELPEIDAAEWLPTPPHDDQG